MTASHSPVKTVQRGVYGQLQIDWLQRFQSISLDFKRKSRLQKEIQTETTTDQSKLTPNGLGTSQTDKHRQTNTLFLRKSVGTYKKKV